MSHGRRPVIAVIGSGRADHRNARLAYAIGALVARRGFHLLTGGGQGVMADASRGFTSVDGRPGLCIGIIPREAGGEGPEKGYPNDWVELPIYTHLAGEEGPASPSSRNPINVRSAAKVIALAGGEGTIAEVTLALRAGKPVLVVQDTENLEAEAGFRQALQGLRCRYSVIDRKSGRLPVEECLAEVEEFLR
jgi:uncharacterized protein (TIGR00725 family)